MNTIQDAVACLRAVATDLERLPIKLALEPQTMTLEAVVNRLRVALPGKSFSIGFEVKFYDFNDYKPEARFTIWDGKTIHEAATLEGAMKTALAAHQPQEPEPVQTCEQLLVGAEAIPF